MPKSSWLMSVALVAIASPAVAQDNTQGEPVQQESSQEPSPAEQAGAVAETADPAMTTGEGAPEGMTEGDPEGGQGDIVVTATRRSEALSDVPLAVSAITAETLENSGVADIRQLNQVLPSLNVSSI